MHGRGDLEGTFIRTLSRIGSARAWTTLWPTTQLNPPPGPSQGDAVATDPITGLTWLVSPTSVWAWDGATGTWTDHSAAGAAAHPWTGDPTAAAMVFDESRGTLVLLVPGTDAGSHPMVHLFERAVP